MRAVSCGVVDQRRANLSTTRSRGSAGMLIRVKEYVNEHGGNDAYVRLFGQGTNSAT
jgi:hypothetical protein